jgi:spore germination protein GerM
MLIAAGLTAATATLIYVLFVGLPRWYGTPLPGEPAVAPAASTAEPERKIKARLFYVADDGTRLTSVEQEIPYGEGTVAQARAIVAAQVAPVVDPLVSAVPSGTSLRTMFITAQGEAYVDLSAEFANAHPGGSMNELLSVYAIVNALTINLPAVSAVQLLVNGKEVDTLAGHIDLRRPLAKNLPLVAEPPTPNAEP